MKLSIGIKALNEELHIADALASALAAAAPFAGEVILADSGSSDRTIEIARTFPVRIVQLADPSERSCGTGAQLAFQESCGDFFCMVDGDMVLADGFIAAAIAYLEGNPRVAGVGGHSLERNIENEEFSIRAAQLDRAPGRRVGLVDRLDGGGVYRAEAIHAVGYFADRNLHAFEEFELGARLRVAGWQLARIDHLAFEHHGHTLAGYALMWRRIRSGYAGGAGEVVRAALGRPHFRQVVFGLGHIRNGLVVIGWWLALLVSALLGAPVALAVLLLLPLAWFWYRRGSPRLGIYSFIGWNSTALGLITGLLHPRRPLKRRIGAINIASKAS